MSHLALLYAGCEGQTRKIVERMSHCLNRNGHETRALSLGDIPENFSLDGADAVVLGSSIRYGKHHRDCYDFIEKYQHQLVQKLGYFFSVNLTARKPERREPYNNLYLQKFLKQIPWTPDKVDVFAGALLYTEYRWLDKQMIRMIMKITGGPTDVRYNTEFTDWNRVKQFAEQLDRDLRNPRFLDSRASRFETMARCH